MLESARTASVSVPVSVSARSASDSIPVSARTASVSVSVSVSLRTSVSVGGGSALAGEDENVRAAATVAAVKTAAPAMFLRW